MRACLRVCVCACVVYVPACVCASALRGQGCRGRRRPSACRRGRVLWRTRAVRGDGGGRRAAFEWRHSCSIQASRCAGGCGDKAPAPLVCAMCGVRQVCDRHSPMDCGGALSLPLFPLSSHIYDQFSTFLAAEKSQGFSEQKIFRQKRIRYVLNMIFVF